MGFETRKTASGEIVLPADVAGDFPTGEQVRVVVMWEAVEGDEAWRSAGRENFEEAYCAEDAVYEQLMPGAPTE